MMVKIHLHGLTIIVWNETKYNADNNTGWEATKSNDDAETPTVYDWNGSAWA